MYHQTLDSGGQKMKPTTANSLPCGLIPGKYVNMFSFCHMPYSTMSIWHPFLLKSLFHGADAPIYLDNHIPLCFPGL